MHVLREIRSHRRTDCVPLTDIAVSRKTEACTIMLATTHHDQPPAQIAAACTRNGPLAVRHTQQHGGGPLAIEVSSINMPKASFRLVRPYGLATSFGKLGSQPSTFLLELFLCGGLRALPSLFSSHRSRLDSLGGGPEMIRCMQSLSICRMAASAG